MSKFRSKDRTTSAGYRFPIASARSEFHETCVPAKSRKPANSAPPAGGKVYSEAEYAKCDVVTQDEIWKQSVDQEKRGVKSWEQNWGFMAEFDPKGRPKTPKELPEEVNMYSEGVPNTQSGQYGSRLNTDIGQAMQRLEFTFNSGNRKKKLGNDLICY